MRPGSRAGSTAYGGAPGTRAGGTSMGRPPATARLQSGLTSSMGRQAAQGIALQQGINITDRPTTMQGMKGMRATTAGPGRLVQDSTYFVGVLRNKVNAITEEIAKLQKEIDEHNKDQSQAHNMQRKAEELDAEVRKLEGTLADYNIAMDKLRQGTDPAELTNYINEFESRNKAFGHEIDRIFLQVKQEEQAFQNVEQQIEAVYRGNQAKINAMDSGKLNHYQELVRLSMQMQEKYQQQVSQVDAIGDQIAMLQSQRESNTFNQDYKSLESQAIRLHKKMQSLTEELDIMKLEPEEMQKRMVAKVRADNSQAQSVDECIRVAKEDLRKSEQVSAELSADLEDRNSGGNSEKDKYEKLYARDNDMTESINKFDGEKKELDKETEETQNRIVKLLAHISTGVESQSSMPTEARAKEV
jgi:intraflagellar transport protein 74